MANELYVYKTKILRIVDGDTVDVAIDLGFDVALSARFRLAGLDAPEKWTDEGKASALRLAELLPVGVEVIVKSEKDRREKFGRYLGTFFVDEVSINEQLVNEGFAVWKKY